MANGGAKLRYAFDTKTIWTRLLSYVTFKADSEHRFYFNFVSRVHKDFDYYPDVRAL